MKTKLFCVVVIFILALFTSCLKSVRQGLVKEPVEYVNTLIGTATFEDVKYLGNTPAGGDSSYYGTVIPGPRTPLGPANPSPVTSFRGLFHARGSGYRHTDSTIMGFVHLNSTVNTHANFLFMPITGELQTKPGELENPDEGYRSRKDYNSEVAKAYYYSVFLTDYKIKGEFSVTDNAAIHRYTFPESKDTKILIDLSITQKFSPLKDAEITIESDRAISGWQRCRGWRSFTANFTAHFYAEFSKPFSNFGTWKDDDIHPGGKNETGKKIGGYVEYQTAKDEKLFVKVGVSFDSIEDAKTKVSREIPDWNFEKVVKSTKKKWNDLLSRIQVEGGTEKQRTLFYTSLFRCYRSHGIIGWPRSGGIIQLLTRPKWVEDWMKNHEWRPTRGDNWWGPGVAPGILGMYNRGMKNFDVEAAYESLYISATDKAKGWSGLEDYTELGFISYYPRNTPGHPDAPDVVNRTLGYAYADYVIANLAKELGKHKDCEYFLNRSKNYKTLFDPQTGFMRAKNQDGKWIEPFDPTIPYHHDYYREGNAWQWTWFMPHDVEGLIELYGGKENFVRKLDDFFSIPFNPPKPIVDVSGIIGQYCHGNETDRFVPYFYNFGDVPWKSQKIIREIMEKLYRATPGGLCGMDDGDLLSSWYVFSALGFYPIDYSSGEYIIGSPVFQKVTIRLPEDYYGDKIFEIECQNYSPQNIYIHSIELNGKAITDYKIRHQDIIQGGKLGFKMAKKALND